ncbi:hypothetical protein ACJX0J_012108, partial [Zea mays]
TVQPQQGLAPGVRGHRRDQGRARARLPAHRLLRRHRRRRRQGLRRPDRRTWLGGATGEEGLADGQPERLQQPHPCSQRLPPHHHRQVRQPRPRHRRPRRTL